MRRAKRIDSNQPDIVEQLRKIPGVSVELEKDDILVGYRGKTFWYEIKNPESLSKKTGKILDSFKKPGQIILENTWNGHYSIITSVEEILKEIEIEY